MYYLIWTLNCQHGAGKLRGAHIVCVGLNPKLL